MRNGTRLPLATDADALRQRTLTLGTDPGMFGCCGLFDRCSDGDLMSLSFEGQNKLLDWLGWSPTLECVKRKEFLTWVRPEQSEGHCTPGYIADPCGDSHGAEWGTCDWEIRDFGRFRRHAPVRDITKNREIYCKNSPRYRLDGALIADERELDMRFATEILLQDLKRHVIIGNSAVAGQFNGLNQLVKTGYTATDGHRCTSMDSIIINWNHNPLTGGPGITWNGLPVGPGFNIVEVLRAVLRHIRQNISYAPSLAASTLKTTDLALVMPGWMTTCLLDYYTCWSVCSNTLYVNDESIRRRDALNGGAYGDGKIFLDGLEVGLLAHDWELTQGPTTGDFYFLIRSIGGVRVLEGEYLDMRSVPGSYPGSDDFDVTDGGRLLTWANYQQTCVQQEVEIQPRLLLWAPWMQVRFEDVVCRGVGLPKSPDPCETSFFPESSFIAPECVSA